MTRTGYLALFCFATIAAAQQSQTLPPITEHIEVTVVNVDVTVLDSSGKPVTGLTQNDFEIREDSIPQEITNFSVVSSTTKQPAGADFKVDPERRRSIVIFIDNRSLFDKPRRSMAVAEIERLLATSPEDSDWSIVMLRLGRLGLQTALPLMSDRQQIDAALDAIRQGRAVSAGHAAPPARLPDAPALPDCPAGGCSATSFRNGINAAQQIESGASFFEGVIQTAREWRGCRGRKPCS